MVVNWFRPRLHAGRARAGRLRLRVESLEGRSLLAQVFPPSPPPQPPLADLSVKVQAMPPSVPNNSNATFLVMAENLGPATARDVVVTNQLPPNATYVTSNPGGAYNSAANTVSFFLDQMQPGQIATFNVIVRPSTGGAVSDSATIVGLATDMQPTNNSSSDTATVQGGVPPGTSDLLLTNIALPPAVFVGQELNDTLIVKNEGPDPATDVAVSTIVPYNALYDSSNPGGSYDPVSRRVTVPVGTLQPGQSQTVVVNIRGTATGPLAIGSDAVSDNTDPNLSNNSTLQTTMVAPTPLVLTVGWYGLGLQPTHLYVYFSSEMDPGLVTNTSNYSLVQVGRAGRDGQSRERAIPIVAAMPDPALKAAILIPAVHLNPHVTYQLTINGTPPQGLANGVGVPLVGSDFVLGHNYTTTLNSSNFAGPIPSIFSADAAYWFQRPNGAGTAPPKNLVTLNRNSRKLAGVNYSTHDGSPVDYPPTTTGPRSPTRVLATYG